jgi:hypothetical protein
LEASYEGGIVAMVVVVVVVVVDRVISPQAIFNRV